MYRRYVNRALGEERLNKAITAEPIERDKYLIAEEAKEMVIRDKNLVRRKGEGGRIMRRGEGCLAWMNGRVDMAWYFCGD